MAEEEHVVLVDEHDRSIGQSEKLEAHKKGLLHRAFSVFLFNEKSEILMQQRADQKYHTGGLWSNTCCSHPEPGETMEAAVHRKLEQELNISAKVYKVFKLRYKASLENGLIENEMDYVFFGAYNKSPLLNPAEVKDWKYMSFDEIRKKIQLNNQSFTPWFKMLIDQVEEVYKQTKTQTKG